MTVRRPESRQPIPEGARRVFKGKLFDVYQWEQQLFDGTTTIFEKLKRPDTAYVIPVAPGGKLTLAQQTQPGAASVIGLLGGRIEEGETPEEGARRELLEEAGLAADDLILWDSFQFLPKLDWAIYIFVARNCTPIERQPVDGGEDIALIQASFDEVLELVTQDKFGDLEVALRLLRLAQDPARLHEAREVFRI